MAQRSWQRDIADVVERLPDGLYAVDDPDVPGRLTAWRVDGARLVPCPAGVRYAPMPPPFRDGHPDGRHARRDHWYATVYASWRRRVVEAIADDPDVAAALYLADPPSAPVAETRPRRRSRVTWPRVSAETRAQRRRAAERLQVTALRSLGWSHRRIAEALKMPLTTVWRRERPVPGDWSHDGWTAIYCEEWTKGSAP